MKRIIFIFGCLFLIGCSQSELEKLKSDKASIEKEMKEQDEIAKKYYQPCVDKTNEYKNAVAKNLPDVEKLKKEGSEVCMKTFNAANKSLELNEEAINLQLAIIEQSAKEAQSHE